jgi:hypothetical protein
MVVVTRSRSTSKKGHCGGGIKILTPSFRASSIKSYKIYNGGGSGRRLKFAANSPRDDELPEEEVIVAETLMQLKTMNKYSCMNPMHPITRYMYRVQVFNSTRTMHYRTSFVGYNNKTRVYSVHTIISNCYPHSDLPDNATDATDAAGLPLPVNTLQTKYSSYINESIENFIMNMVIPSREYDYYIQDDMFGVVTTETEFCDAAFGQDSSYYDIERLLHDESSNETINGFKAFSLIPSRSYWFDPLVVESHTSAYSSYTIHSVLNILSQSQ